MSGCRCNTFKPALGQRLCHECLTHRTECCTACGVRTWLKDMTLTETGEQCGVCLPAPSAQGIEEEEVKTEVTENSRAGI